MNDLMPTLLYILAFTVSIQIVGAVAIYFTLPDAIATDTSGRLWLAVFHSVSGFCNVGFSNIEGGMSNPVLMQNGTSLYVVMSVLVFAGALGFPILANFKDGIAEYCKRLWAWVLRQRRGYHRVQGRSAVPPAGHPEGAGAGQACRDCRACTEGSEEG